MMRRPRPIGPPPTIPADDCSPETFRAAAAWLNAGRRSGALLRLHEATGVPVSTLRHYSCGTRAVTPQIAMTLRHLIALRQMLGDAAEAAA